MGKKMSIQRSNKKHSQKGSVDYTNQQNDSV